MFRSGDRHSPELLNERFADIPAPLSSDQARVEAARCLYCFDAPCTRACPTHIDVPKFIRQILHHDEISAAHTILEANIFGGSCARACPTEVLCEGACVDRLLFKSPVQIGRLQRYACDTAGGSGFDDFEAGPRHGKACGDRGIGPCGAFLCPRTSADGPRRDDLRSPQCARRSRHARNCGVQDFDQVCSIGN